MEVNLEDPIIADNTKMTGAERRLSEQLYCVLALTCRKRALQIVQQVPRGYVFEAWRQQCQKFETASSGEIEWNAPGPLVVDEISRAEAVGPWKNRGKVCEDQSGDEVPDRPCSSGNSRVFPSKIGVCGVWKREPHRPGAVGR